MRNPNSYGSVYKLQGNRRRPWVVAITAGTVYDEAKDEVRYKKKILGYFAKQKEAIAFLADYNKKGLTPESLEMTLQDVWLKVKDRKLSSVGSARAYAYDNAFRYLNKLKDEPFRDLRTVDLQEVIDECQKGAGIKRTIKTLLNLCYDFALENDICDKNYAHFIKIKNEDSKIERVILSERVSRCEFAANEPFCDIVTILVYTGMRINELLKNTADNFNPADMTLSIPKELAKNKTSVRIIPIHKDAQPAMLRFMNLSERPDYQQVYSWMKIKGFTPHSTRYTFATKAHECRMDDLTIKRILGHSPDNITQKLYTKITLEDMKKELAKLKY